MNYKLRISDGERWSFEFTASDPKTLQRGYMEWRKALPNEINSHLQVWDGKYWIIVTLGNTFAWSALVDKDYSAAFLAIERAYSDSNRLMETIDILHMAKWTTAQAAQAWGISERRVRALLKAGRVPGAYRDTSTANGAWVIPAQDRPDIRPAGRPKEDG